MKIERKCWGPNETYDTCPPNCDPQLCSGYIDYTCSDYGPPDNCKPACRCKDGYYRNDDNICVSLDECGKFVKL